MERETTGSISLCYMGDIIQGNPAKKPKGSGAIIGLWAF